MSEKHAEIANFWKREYCSKLETSSKYEVPDHFKRMADLMAPGNSYYYIANFHTLQLELVSNSVTRFTGKKPSEVNLDILLSLALPEEIENIHLKERVISDFFSNHLQTNEVKNYKLAYTYKCRDYNGTERVMLHQATVLSLNENGRFVHVFSIHSDISHLVSASTADISFININGGESYYNIDASQGRFDKLKLEEKRRLRDILSDRELEIIQEMARGNNADEISSRLNISIHTVKTHRRNILRKTESRNSTQLVSVCLAEGLINI